MSHSEIACRFKMFCFPQGPKWDQNSTLDVVQVRDQGSQNEFRVSETEAEPPGQNGAGLRQLASLGAAGLAATAQLGRRPLVWGPVNQLIDLLDGKNRVPERQQDFTRKLRHCPFGGQKMFEEGTFHVFHAVLGGNPPADLPGSQSPSCLEEASKAPW